MRKVPILIIALAIGGLNAAEKRPTDIDTLLHGREFKLPALDSSLRSGKDNGTNAPVAKAQAGEGIFTLQFDAIADFDAAQKRRDDLQRITGYNIQMVFDAPFYKLRAGNWSKKTQAEDEARALAAREISAFVVKLK